MAPINKRAVQDDLILEDAKIIFRNFRGEGGLYNAEGKRNFSVVLDPETAQKVIDLGWNVRVKSPREEGDEPLYHLPVNVKFGMKPPMLYLVTRSKNSKTPLDEETASLLDYADLETVDLILRPYNWSVNGNSGVTAYLKKGFFVIREDELDMKYADMQDVEEVKPQTPQEEWVE